MKDKLDKLFTRWASAIARWAGQLLTFILAIATVIVWAVTGPVFQFSETWQLVINTGTTIVTFLMVFLIQNEQNRDTAAMQAKLDELLNAVEGARVSFIGIEHLTTAEVEQVRADIEREHGAPPSDKRKAANKALEGLGKAY